MKYTVVSTLTLGPGTKLGLSKEQAASRAHLLTPAGKGHYITNAHVQFKAGEEINCDDELPKHAAQLVEKAGKAPPAAPGGDGKPPSDAVI